jgi:hypothetical protein
MSDLSVGAGERRPVVRKDDRIEVATLMTVTLTRDQEQSHHIKSRLDFAGMAVATLTADQVDGIRMTFKSLMGAMSLRT